MKIREYVGSKIYNLIVPYMKGEQKMKFENKERYLLEEKYVWYKGDENTIAEFYQSKNSGEEFVDVRSEYYYAYVGQPGVRVVHSGLPQLLCGTMANLIYGKGAKITATNEGKEVEKVEELIKDIVKENDLQKKIKELIENRSWAGKVAYKISFDKEVSEFPIVEVYDALSYKVIKKLGKIQEIRFSNYIDEEYELVDVRGKGFIDYILYKHKNGKTTEVPLTELEETADLERIEFKDQKRIILAGEIEGRSLYNGIISEFDALDEAWSQYFDEIRSARSETYVPENLLTEKTWNKFNKNYVQIGEDLRENGSNEIKHVQPDIRSEEYAKTIAKITANILMNAKLSPFTVGIDDTIGANTSGESLAKREKTSLRTRDAELKDWEEFCAAMIYNLLYAYGHFNNKQVEENVEIAFKFGEYIGRDRKEKIEAVTTLKDGGIIDTQQALEEVYGNELSEETKQRILENTGDYIDTAEETEV